MVDELLEYGEPMEVVWFENPYTKALRKFRAGQSPIWVNPKDQLDSVGLGHLPFSYVGHHQSHAAAGFYTSGFKDATVLVVDAIGEWDSLTIWEAEGNSLSKRLSIRYPDSMGLFYSAMTQYIGLKPNEEEYILMGMAAYGRVNFELKSKILKEFFIQCEGPNFELRHNLHRGCQWWEEGRNYKEADIAACVQSITEDFLLSTVHYIANTFSSKNLVFMGGVALNCVANRAIAQSRRFDNIWIMPNPGDAGSAIGAVAAKYDARLNWRTAFLGTNIKRELDIDKAVKCLQAGEVIAIANGRAEFGPRALGNRSLLCDPRGPNAKALMNTIKKREQFRPFAPAVLAEYAKDFFNMPVSSTPYMQFVAKCTKPDLLPAICHIDNTSRVQTVLPENNSQFRTLLERWYDVSGCPVLMNTSLNIKGEPLVNTWEDAERFQNLHGIKIF
jgi:carbamoyltransferase